MSSEEPDALPQGGLSNVPSARIWNLSFANGVLNDVFQQTSPPYAGPGLIDFLAVTAIFQAGATKYEALQMSYSQTPGPTNNLTPSPLNLPGTIFYDGNFADDAGTGATDPGIPILGDGTTRSYKFDLQIYVPHKTWHLNFGFVMRLAVLHRFHGYFRIVENVKPLEVS